MSQSASERQASQTEQGTWNRLVTFHTQVSELVEKTLQDRFGLSLSEYTALEALARVSGSGRPGLRMQALAEAVGMNQSSVSRLVTRLERQDLVERIHYEKDRRGVFTAITASGRETLDAAVPAYLQTLAAAFDRANTDPDLRELVKRIGS